MCVLCVGGVVPQKKIAHLLCNNIHRFDDDNDDRRRPREEQRLLAVLVFAWR